MTTYHDLRAAIRRTGSIPADVVEQIARARADQEDAAYRRMGCPQDYAGLLDTERAFVTGYAKQWLADTQMEREVASLSPAERAARQCELRAEMAESAIPPDPVKVAFWRESARVCRATSWRAVMTDDDLHASIAHAAE